MFMDSKYYPKYHWTHQIQSSTKTEKSKEEKFY